MSNIIEITLPISGKTAVMRRPTGKDMVDAEVLAGSIEKQFAYQAAVASRIALIDGKTLPYEDFLELDAEDISFMGKQEFPSSQNPLPESV